jgi:AAA domain/DnaB-like helicase N terminal domain
VSGKQNGRTKYHFDGEALVRLERCILGALLESPSLWGTEVIEEGQFTLADHNKIYKTIADLNAHSCVADLSAVAAQLGAAVHPSILAEMVAGVVPANFASYVKQWKAARRERELRRLQEQLSEATTAEDRRRVLGELQALEGESDSANWRDVFHSWKEFENAPPLAFAINGFLQEAGVTLIGGLAGQGKTLIMLAMVKALLEESPLFGYEPFSVSRSAKRICYLIPESSIGPFWSRIKLFRLEEYVREDRLLIRTLSSPEQVTLTDPRILKAVEGADIFLDSVIRFTVGSENDAENIRLFSDVLFRLLHAGARTITGCHHSPKSFESAQSMSLENVLRGSGDLGALVSTCWGIRQVDSVRNRIYVENCKPRDFQPCAPFLIEGRPHLDATGQFAMSVLPGEAEELRSYLQLKGGRPLAPDRAEQMAMAASLRDQKLSLREIAAKMRTSKSSVERMLFDFDTEDHSTEEKGRKPQ